jgi:glucosamine--fructose-6-phosphate aminotransferase (isomerizing)
MCGIVGYIGDRPAAPIILKALKQLEYRGYDSAGIAVANNGIAVIKDAGKIEEIEKKHDFLSLRGNAGIGHTRWATHGMPTRENAHPHLDCSGKIAIVHNGIIENYAELKEKLLKKGHRFRSDTDSEVIAHLIEENAKGAVFRDALLKSLRELDGSYAVAVLHEGEKRVYAARKGSPLVIGKGKEGMFCASDMPALLDNTRDFVFVHDDEFVVMEGGGFELINMLTNKKVKRELTHVDWTVEMAKKEGYPHFMLKEIMEQRYTIRNAINADVKEAVSLLRKSEHVEVVGAGTSYYAGLVFKQLIQKLARRRCNVVISSEFSTFSLVDEKTLVVAISQSGETADTLVAVRSAKEKGAKVLGITNVVGSTLTRESDGCIYLGAGPEIAVVATKSFTSQLAVLYKCALMLAGMEERVKEMIELVPAVEGVLGRESEIKLIASKLNKYEDFFFIGRSFAYPIAMEGALKLKEITYMHAEAYPAGELKHGPLSMLEEGVPVIAIAPTGEKMSKMIGNIKECKARGAMVVGISDNEDVLKEAEMKLRMPQVDELFAPIVYIVPLQLLAYHIAVMQGKDPDKPRNLAKSCTVE